MNINKKAHSIPQQRHWYAILLGLGLLAATPGLAHSTPVRPLVAPTALPLAQASNSLLSQVQQCIQQELAQATTPPANLQDVASRCLFSVVILNPNGTVRTDAGDRMAEFLQASGVQMPKPMGRGQADVPVYLQPDQPIFSVPVTIQGQTFLFALDTGASNSILSHPVAQKLGLKGKPVPSQMLRYLVVGQQSSEQKALIYVLPLLKVGTAQVKTLAGIGLSTASLPFKTAGVLGLDFLSRFDMVLNPQTRRLQLRTASAPVSTGIPLRGNLGVMVTSSVTINGKGTYRFLVDTGAAMTVISTQLAQQLALDLTTSTPFNVIGFGGQEQARRIRLASFTIPTQSIPNLNVLVINSQVLQTLGVDGVIGQDVLNRFVQHWRFGPPGPLGSPETGSLELWPIGKPK